MLKMVTTRRWLPVAVTSAVCGCSDPVAPVFSPDPPPDVTPYVGGNALAALDADGHFRLDRQLPPTPHPSIDASAARDIAQGVIRSWYTNPNATTLPGLGGLVESAEGQRGAPIDWPSIRPAERLPFLAESHLLPLPDSAGNPAIRTYGPHYLVPFEQRGEWVLVVSVSAHSTNVFLSDDGFIRRRDNLDGGGEFGVTGISILFNGLQIPPAPERAVQFAFQRTGVPVIEVPRLGTPGNYWEANGARWQLQLERPVQFERLADGAPVTTSVIYVAAFSFGFDRLLSENWTPGPVGLRLMVPAPDQPATQRVGEVEASIRPGYHVKLFEVKVAQ